MHAQPVLHSTAATSFKNQFTDTTVWQIQQADTDTTIQRPDTTISSNQPSPQVSQLKMSTQHLQAMACASPHVLLCKMISLLCTAIGITSAPCAARRDPPACTCCARGSSTQSRGRCCHAPIWPSALCLHRDKSCTRVPPTPRDAGSRLASDPDALPAAAIDQHIIHTHTVAHTLADRAWCELLISFMGPSSYQTTPHYGQPQGSTRPGKQRRATLHLSTLCRTGVPAVPHLPHGRSSF